MNKFIEIITRNGCKVYIAISHIQVIGELTKNKEDGNTYVSCDDNIYYIYENYNSLIQRLQAILNNN